MRLLLIPVAHALPAVQAYLATQPDDGSALSPEELQKLDQLFMRVIQTSELLASYAVALAGRPRLN